MRSVRLPDFVWADLQKAAKKRGTTAHALLREMVIAGLSRGAA